MAFGSSLELFSLLAHIQDCLYRGLTFALCCSQCLSSSGASVPYESYRGEKKRWQSCCQEPIANDIIRPSFFSHTTVVKEPKHLLINHEDWTTWKEILNSHQLKREFVSCLSGLCSSLDRAEEPCFVCSADLYSETYNTATRSLVGTSEGGHSPIDGHLF